MAYANVLLKTVGPVAAGFGLWYLLIDRGNDKIREEFEKSQGKGNARDGSPLVKNTEKELMVKTILGGKSTFDYLHTVRNLHFLSKNSTSTSRENCRAFLLDEKLVKMLWLWTF